jgi:hypothetical protein
VLEECEGRKVDKALLVEARKMRDALKKSSKKAAKGVVVGEAGASHASVFRAHDDASLIGGRRAASVVGGRRGTRRCADN